MSYFLCSEIGEFQKIVGGFIGMVDGLAKEVEREKMKVKIFVLPKFVDAISLVMIIKRMCFMPRSDFSYDETLVLSTFLSKLL